MKISILIGLFAFSFIHLNSQILQKPAGQPGKVSLPAPKIQPPTPADLQITGLTLVSAVTKTDLKMILVTVRVTVKNSGQTSSPSSLLSASAKGQAAGSVWADAGNTVQVQALNGSQACTNEITFKFPMQSVNGDNSCSVYSQMRVSG